MRVNPNYFPNILNAIGQTQQASQDALLQMSSGKRVNTPSDDPAASATMVQLSAHGDQIDQYTKNVTSMLNLMQVTDSALSSVVTALNQAIAAGVQGATGTVSAANRQSLMQQVQGILTTVVSQANLEYRGVYLFSGTSSSLPFTSSGSGYQYNGNSNSNSVPVGDGLSLKTGLPGDQVFQSSGGDVLGSLQQLASALQSGTGADIGDATNAVRSALDHVSQMRVFYGNSMSQLNQQQTYLQTATTNLKTQENTLIAADPAQAITQFTQAQTAHSATLAASARLVQNTLLDYLK